MTNAKENILCEIFSMPSFIYLKQAVNGACYLVAFPSGNWFTTTLPSLGYDSNSIAPP